MAANPYQPLFQRQEARFFAALKCSTVHERRASLARLRQWILRHEDDICQAVRLDRGKPEVATLTTEVNPVLGEIRHTMRHLHQWMSPRRVPTPIHLIGGRSWVMPEPKGVCLVISPWNFPFMLSLMPVVSAVAAGNAVVLKPSEDTPHTSALLAKLVAEVWEEEHVALVQGGVPEATQLLQLPWAHIFFTGSTAVGKVVMRAAAEHLSGVTLELGGANPAIVDKSADLRDAAVKLVWGRFFNDGASCVSPNHIFVEEQVHDALAAEMVKAMRSLFGNGGYDKSGACGRMIHERHWQRTLGLLEQARKDGAEVAEGGSHDRQTLHFSPTLLTGVGRHSALVQEETFGPLLPLVKYKDLGELLSWQQGRPIPLALYVFTRSRMVSRLVTSATRSGGMGYNQTTLQFPQMNLPFGGQGASGLGKGHGAEGFEGFSNMRSAYQDPRRLFALRLLMPPYRPWKKRLIRLMNRYF